MVFYMRRPSCFCWVLYKVGQKQMSANKSLCEPGTTDETTCAVCMIQGSYDQGHTEYTQANGAKSMQFHVILVQIDVVVSNT